MIKDGIESGYSSRWQSPRGDL